MKDHKEKPWDSRAASVSLENASYSTIPFMKTLLTSLTVILSLITLGHSQDTASDSAGVVTAGQPGQAQASNADAAPVFDLEFKGGKIEQLLDAIAGKLGRRPNVIIPDSLKGSAFPSFEVAGVDLTGLFEALGLATPFAFESTASAGDEGRIWVLKGPVSGDAFGGGGSFGPSRFGAGGLRASGFDGAIGGGVGPITRQAGDPVIPPTVERSAAFPGTSSSQTALTRSEEPKTKTQPLGIGDLLEAFSVEDITTAILQTWESADNDGPRGKMAFHKDANLLILTATPEELSLANVVISELGKEAGRRGREPKAGNLLEEATGLLQEAKGRQGN